jgi:O-methyltransferase
MSTRHVDEQVVMTLLRARAMRRPTFPQELHAQIAFHDDYYRYATHALAVQRIIEQPIEGAFAEVGVFKGDMTRFLHALAPDRTYYLFDTFEGFPRQDLEHGGDDTRFDDTSLEAVLASLHSTDNIVPRKGYVPDTFAGLEDERFAFLLADVDLHAPTVAALEFFYPRLATGGYVFVHDYNSTESGWACKRALDEFMSDKPEQLIEISDIWGTAVFRKV